MNNSIQIIAIIAVVAALGLGAYSLSQNSSQPNSVLPIEETSIEPNNAMMKKDDSSLDDEKMMNDEAAGSRYVHYSKPTLDNASSNRRVLFFYASWCPTCKPADAEFTQDANRIPTDVTLIRVNYNDPETDQEEKDLARKYGITYQHTFVQIDSAGNEVTKWNGGQIDELLSNIK